MAREVAKTNRNRVRRFQYESATCYSHCQEDINEKVAAASSQECGSRWWEENSNLVRTTSRLVQLPSCLPRCTHDDEENVRAADCHCVAEIVVSSFVEGVSAVKEMLGMLAQVKVRFRCFCRWGAR